STCFDPQSAGIPAFLGASAQRFNGPFSLETLGPCEDDDGGSGNPPITGPQCNAPLVDPGSNPGLYLWQDCTETSANVWEGIANGGGGRFQRYTGTFESIATLVAEGSLLESTDTVDASPGDGIVDFDLRVLNLGQDGLKVTIPLGEAACVNPQSIPGGNLFVGQNKLRMNAPFSTDGLTACN
ncbi:MAG: hypothetical protein AAGI15_03740, partial [Pseudomonadota bacterium]